MVYDIYHAPDAEDGLTATEVELVQLIENYRVENGLPVIPVSYSLSLVAARHVEDIIYNLDGLQPGAPGTNSGHSWSDAPYNALDPSTYTAIWQAPQRLGTSYPGYGYEILVGYTAPNTASTTITPQTALSGWKSSAPHNAVILNQSPWNRPDLTWNAIGAGMLDGVASVWFGHETDPAGSPDEYLHGDYAPPRIVSGSTAGDLIFGSDDRFPGVAYDEIFFGNGGADIIYGNAGKDWIWGAVGDLSTDTFYGGDGSDVLVSFSGNDWLEGNNGDDLLISDAGNDTLLGGPGNDQLWAGSGADSLYGWDGNDILVGADASQPQGVADFLDGGEGNDLLISGGSGGSMLVGGNGDDQLWSSGAGDLSNAGAGADLIVSVPATLGSRASIDPGVDGMRDQVILDNDGIRPQDVITSGQSATQTTAGTDVIWYFSPTGDRLLVRASDHTGALQSSFNTFPAFGNLSGTLMTNGGAPVVFLAAANTTVAELTANGALLLL